MPNWTDSNIVNDPRIDQNDPHLREAAEKIHRNESLHRHDHEGEVCVYCALNAAMALSVARPVPTDDLAHPYLRVERAPESLGDCMKLIGRYTESEGGNSAETRQARANLFDAYETWCELGRPEHRSTEGDDASWSPRS